MVKIVALTVVAIVVMASASVASADAPTDKGPVVLRVTPNSLHFGRQPVGSTSIATLTITNVSEATVHLCCFGLLFDIKRGETGNMSFEEPCGPSQPGGIPLAPGSSCTVPITFQPINFPGRVVYIFTVGYLESLEPDKVDPRNSVTLTGVGV